MSNVAVQPIREEGENQSTPRLVTEQPGAAPLHAPAQNAASAPLPMLRFGVEDQSKGTVVVVPGSVVLERECETEVLPFAQHYPVLVAAEAPTAATAVSSYPERLETALRALKVKRLSLIGFGLGATALIRFCVQDPELIRRVVLVDPVFRSGESSKERFLGFVESVIPMGLPLYTSKLAFDTRSFIHRLRCPVSIVHTPQGEPLPGFIKRIPNARLLELREPPFRANGRLTPRMIEHIESFLEVPVKRSQKGLHENS